MLSTFDILSEKKTFLAGVGRSPPSTDVRKSIKNFFSKFFVKNLMKVFFLQNHVKKFDSNCYVRQQLGGQGG